MKEAVKALKEIRKGLAALKPPGSASARNLLKAYGQFFKGQEKTFREDLAEIVRSLEEKNPPEPRECERLRQQIENFSKREQAQLKALQQAERAFAREHNLPVIKEKR
jgi:hypothetical protein